MKIFVVKFYWYMYMAKYGLVRAHEPTITYIVPLQAYKKTWQEQLLFCTEVIRNNYYACPLQQHRDYSWIWELVDVENEKEILVITAADHKTRFKEVVQCCGLSCRTPGSTECLLLCSDQVSLTSFATLVHGNTFSLKKRVCLWNMTTLTGRK